MSSTNNTTLVNSTENKSDGQPSATVVILLAFLVVSGTLANGYITVVLLKKSRRSPLNMTIVNLALVDTLILLLVVPMCLVTLALRGVTMSLCLVTGIIGPILVIYSLQIQCLILYVIVRTVTRSLPNNKTAISLIRLAIISVICLATDTCVLVYSSLIYGTFQSVPSIGYCFVNYDKSILYRKLMSIFYGVHLSGSVLLCTVFYTIMTQFVRKTSTGPVLARQRQVLIFKMVFRKLLIWVLCYSLIIVVRIVGYKNKWPEGTFQASYFLMWSNSLLNPLCHILTSPLRSTIFSRWSNLVATVAPQRHSQLPDQRSGGGNQHSLSPSGTNAQQSNSVDRRRQSGSKSATHAPVGLDRMSRDTTELTTDAEETQKMNL